MSSKFLMSRKMVDVAVEKWESDYGKGKVTEPLPHYIAKCQAIFLLNILIEKGYDQQEAKEELQKILSVKS